MVRGRKFFGDYGRLTPEEMQNKMFEQYYKGQNIVSEEEWSLFSSCMQKELPATFRITGFRDQSLELLWLLKNEYFENIFKITTQDSEDLEAIALRRLTWYPGELAWQLDASKRAIRKTKELKKLHEFLLSETESGNISRQEAVSMLPPLVMDIRAHHAVLDLCAAPGSKSAQIVELMHADSAAQPDQTCNGVLINQLEPPGILIANDLDAKRCYMMVHQLKRLQSPCALTTQHDATIFPKLYLTPEPSRERLSDCHDKASSRQLLFDRILADVPCSGDGTMRKNPDLWLRWTPNLAIGEHFLQARILRRGLELLKDPDSENALPEESPGYSRLIYSTCSLNPIEDEAVVASILVQCQGAVQLVEHPLFTTDETDGQASDTRSSSGVNEKRFKARKGLTTWRVMTKDGTWYESFDAVPTKYE